MDDIAQQLNGLDIDNHDQPTAALQVVTDLLNRLRNERQQHAKEQRESTRHTALLKASVAKLASQNTVLHARLLATLDSLDVAQHKLDASELEEENKALLVLNANLGQRLRDANAERNQLAEALSTRHNSTRPSDRSSISFTRQVQHYNQPPQQDVDNDDGQSDTTEVQGYSRAAVNKAESQRLRTRTVLLELIEEVESGRKRLKQTETEKEEAVSLLQAHLETRDREIASLHQQLSDISILPALADMATSERDGESVPDQANLSQTQSLLQDLNEQVRRLKSDLEYLRNERDSIRTYVYSASVASGRSEDADEDYSSREIARLSDQIASQREEFDVLAARARDKLEEQQVSLDASREEVNDLHKTLHQVEQLASEANAALSDEKARREGAERLLLTREAPTASEMGSPRSTPRMTRRYSLPAFTDGYS